jgi:chromosome segregation ATPase
MLFVGLLSAIAGAVLALVFLFMLNGTIDFRSATVQTVQGEVARFEGELQAVHAELEQVESQLELIGEVAARLDEAQATIEQLGGAVEVAQSRLGSMSDEVVTLRQEFTNVREDVDGMAGLVSDLGRRMNALSESVQRSDAFLNGLAGLLDRLQAGQRPTVTPWVTPTPTSAMTAVPRATSTPSGQ